VAFSKGRRVCLGSHLASAELTMGLALISTLYDWEIVAPITLKSSTLDQVSSKGVRQKCGESFVFALEKNEKFNIMVEEDLRVCFMERKW
jgi:hypothetical protein